MSSEKMWDYNNIITKYIVEKTRNGYETSTTEDEMIDFLRYITKHINIKDSTKNYEEVLEEYKNRDGNKTKVFGFKKGLEVEFKSVPIVEKKGSGLLVPTYDLMAHMYKKMYEPEQYIKMYLKKTAKKREIDSSLKLTEDSIEFGEKAAAALLLNYWKRQIRFYIDYHIWPEQCTDIKEFLLDTDLASIIKLKPRREELVNFYIEIANRISYISQNDPLFQMSNFKNDVLAKSNFDLIMNGYQYYSESYASQSKLVGTIVRIEKEASRLRIIKELFYGDIIDTSLDDPQILKLVKDIKDIKK